MAGSLFEIGVGKLVILLPFMLKSPAIFTASLICMAVESPELILLVTNVGAVNVPDTFNPSATCTAVESLLEI